MTSFERELQRHDITASVASMKRLYKCSLIEARSYRVRGMIRTANEALSDAEAYRSDMLSLRMRMNN